jgi:PPIC-type PPIASE domain
VHSNQLLGLLVIGMACSLAYGQPGKTPASPVADENRQNPPVPEAAPGTTVGPDDPVITINGFCGEAGLQGNTCKTVITRTQFEKLVEALQPGMPLPLRLKVANAYARNIRMSASAEKRGLDKTLAFEEEMRYARMQLLSQDLDRALRADASNISEADVDDYYEKNKPSFEQVTVARIFVPPQKRIEETHDGQVSAGKLSEAQEKASSDSMTEVAADLRARAANGEDPDKLQIAAYAEAGIERTAADTRLEKVRRATLPPQHESVMDMKPGEVSEVFSDPGGAHFIYKMINKETLTLKDVQAEIRTAIADQRYRNSIKSFQGDVVFSDAYFNPPRSLTAPSSKKASGRMPTGHD